ncbi:MAG: hypothetical protein HUU15_16120, partial [Candidatus Brocadiae bacterium]|nr:hypothetical protein [Candidatus Brocadiia bacterium]
VGDFRPAGVGTARAAVATADASGLDVTVYDPPQAFSTRPWTALPAKDRRIPADQLLGTPLFVAAGNLLGGKGDPDLLLVLLKTGETGLAVAWVKPPLGENESATLVRRERLTTDAEADRITGFAVGDFWGSGEDALALAESLDGATFLRFLRWGREVSPSACFVKVVNDASAELPPLVPGGLAAADPFQDGFDLLVLAPADPAAPLQLRSAPSRQLSLPPDPGPVYTGRALSRMPLPGFGRDVSAVGCTATLENLRSPAGAPLPLAAGQLFGYVRADLTPELRAATPLEERPDAEICFVHRVNTPSLTEGAPQFGWPAFGEETSWQVVLRNNGTSQLPAGTRVRVWRCAERPNADLTGAPPDEEWQWEAMPALDPEKPRYFVRTVKGPWPWKLRDCPGGRWKRLDMEVTGERWMIVSIDNPADACERNNRLEVPWHGVTLHPLLRTAKSLADRRPSVPGDPPSREYLLRKLADAVSAAWSRSGDAENRDALVRVFFDGYETGWVSDLPEKDRDARWKDLRAKYEGTRELDAHEGVGQTWERFGWKDGTGELRETGRFYHPIGDLTGGAVSPSVTGLTPMGNSLPVQIASSYWGPDTFSTGHAMAGTPAAEFVRRFLAGTRGTSCEAWWELAPDRVSIRVLDRAGKPVPDATVSVYGLGRSAPIRTGKTDASGKFDTGHAPEGSAPDLFGRKRWKKGLPAEAGVIVTVSAGDCHDAVLLGGNSTEAHGRYALFHHAMVNEQEWIFDVALNWAPGAPAADFTLEAPVQGTAVELRAVAAGARTWRVWRRQEPSWHRALVGEYPSSDGSLLLPLDLTTPDSWGKDRRRVRFEVTSVVDGVESGSRSIYVTAVLNALGLARWTEEQFAVSAQGGTADPYALVTRLTSPERELLAHPRSGRTARKILRMPSKPSRAFVTLKASDSEPPVFLEMLDTDASGAWAPRYDLGGTRGRRGNVKELRVKDGKQLGELNVGDFVTWNGRSARVSSIRLDAVTLEKPIFDMTTDVVQVTFTRAPGMAGDRAPSRELRDPRALLAVTVKDREYLVVCDTGNERFVVWDDTTKYICGYGGPKFRPCGLAADPRDPRVFFVVDRRADRKSHVLRFTFNGQGLEKDHTWNVDVGDWEGDEQGLACRPMRDEHDRVQLAVTDGSGGRILLFTVTPDRLVPNGDIAAVTGPHAGPDSLRNPIDCLFVPKDREFRIFAVDGRDRIVEAGAAVKGK